MPTYGRGFQLSNPSDHGMGAAAQGTLQDGPLTSAAGFLAYYEVRARLFNVSGAFISLPFCSGRRCATSNFFDPIGGGVYPNLSGCLLITTLVRLSLFQSVTFLYLSFFVYLRFFAYESLSVCFFHYLSLSLTLLKSPFLSVKLCNVSCLSTFVLFYIFSYNNVFFGTLATI